MSFGLTSQLSVGTAEQTAGGVAAVLSRLSAHAEILEQEVLEIGRDCRQVETLAEKYGETFVIPLGHLHDLRKRKKALLLEIIERLEAVQGNLASSESFVGELDASREGAAQRPAVRVRTVSPTRLPSPRLQWSGRSLSPRSTHLRPPSPSVPSAGPLPRKSWVPSGRGRTSPIRR
eukprot:TRINITY_DN16027_c0_g1_i1.p1 TRINITY_DN16027_c0_g1~~TRINITY_DN16027_c0_g1_i1.p1  ORF type:complete len:176 (+),score=43.93 TRINITY_DN16027_c0_g1_i1:79-606(+)